MKPDDVDNVFVGEELSEFVEDCCPKKELPSAADMLKDARCRLLGKECDQEEEEV